MKIAIGCDHGGYLLKQCSRSVTVESRWRTNSLRFAVIRNM